MVFLVAVYLNLNAFVDTTKLSIKVLTRSKNTNTIVVTYEDCLIDSFTYTPTENFEKDYLENIKPWWKNVLTKIKEKCK